MKGASGPRTPSGKAALVQPTPHHISAEAIQVNFHVDPATAAPLLPSELELDEPALGYAYVADMVKATPERPDEPAAEPQMTQYNEGIVGLLCRERGGRRRRGRYSIFIWVDRDWSLVFGHLMGLPKKLADIHRTRWHELNPAMGPLRPGVRLGGTVDRMGQRLVHVGIELQEQMDPEDVRSRGGNVFLHRYLPSPRPDTDGIDETLILDLTTADVRNAWRGAGTVELGTSPYEDLDAIRPLQVESASFFQRGWTTDLVARPLA